MYVVNAAQLMCKLPLCFPSIPLFPLFRRLFGDFREVSRVAVPSGSHHSKMLLNGQNFKHSVHRTALSDEHVSHIISALADMI